LSDSQSLEYYINNKGRLIKFLLEAGNNENKVAIISKIYRVVLSGKKYEHFPFKYHKALFQIVLERKEKFQDETTNSLINDILLHAGICCFYLKKPLLALNYLSKVKTRDTNTEYLKLSYLQKTLERILNWIAYPALFFAFLAVLLNRIFDSFQYELIGLVFLLGIVYVTIKIYSSNLRKKLKNL